MKINYLIYSICVLLILNSSYLFSQKKALKGINFYATYAQYFGEHFKSQNLRLDYGKSISREEYIELAQQYDFAQQKAIIIRFDALPETSKKQEHLYQDSILLQLSRLKIIQLEIHQSNLETSDTSYQLQLKNLFKQLEKLENLDALIVFSNLQELPGLSSLKNLRILSLHGILEISTKALPPNLKHLSISANMKESMPLKLSSKVVSKLRIFHTVDLYFKYFSKPKEKNTDLLSLWLNVEQFESKEKRELPTWFFNTFPNLVELKLTCPKINCLSTNFGKFSKIKFLRIDAPLSNLKKGQLPKNLQNCQLRWLGKKRNLKSAIKNLNELKALSLVVDNIESIPNTFGKELRLTKLAIFIKQDAADVFEYIEDEELEIIVPQLQAKFQKKLNRLKKELPNTKIILTVGDEKSLEDLSN